MPSLYDLYFSGVYPNYANSPLPNPADTTNCTAPNFCGIRKFVDTLPMLNQVNNLGGMLPVAVPDTITFPGSDYYEISLVQFRQKLHSDLPPTLIRGYVQTNYGSDASGANTIAPGPLSYLGPIIVSNSNRPVRIKFTNALPSVNNIDAADPLNNGNLFIPTDTSVSGSGLGLAKGLSPYLQNRATVHLHGGNTPWISDGTPHQWTVPASDWNNTLYDRGDSVAFVPDMFFVNGTVVPQCGAQISGATVTTNCSDPSGKNNATTLPAGATNDPGNGSLTFYYTNQQSSRLLFYHDHAYGITRLNVYAGEASGYLIRDQAELDMMNGSNVSGVFTAAGLAPAPVLPKGDAEIPLIIQDKGFVPQNFASTTVYSVPVLAPGSGYTNAAVSFSGGCTTEPVATATVGDMADPFGQMIFGAVTGITLVSPGSGCTSGPTVNITGDGAGAAAFASLATLSQQDPTWDPAIWGGYGNFWFPHIYMTNQWPGNPDGSNTNPMGRWDYAGWFWPPFNGQPGQYTVRGEVNCPAPYDSTMMCPGVPAPGDAAPATEVSGATHQGVGSTVSLTPEAFLDTPVVNGTPYPSLTVDPKAYRFRILSIANERTFNLSWFLACDSTGGTSQYSPTPGATCPADTVTGSNFTEVGMVPAVQAPGFPAWYPNDARAGGVPDPAAMGPNWVEIASEGGVLPAPAIIPPTPITYEQNLRSVTVTNIQNHGLLLMSAERADAIVDFSAYAGKTLILYNDAPAPAPAYDTRNDYYSGDPDQTGTGGAPSTLPGFGPNTRTIMQVHVRSGVAGQPQPAVNMAALNALIPAAFKLTQPVPVVPEAAYSKAYGQTMPNNYAKLQSQSMTFTPIDPVTQKLSTQTNPATGNATVTIPLRFKTIQELFDYDYGRMNATLGTELPFSNFNTQTTIPLGYIDPFTEDIYDSAGIAASPVGFANDGSQIWMVVHNGVDSHAIHFHLYNVQLINRFGWDGTNRPPFPNELGWKDTVRMNPLEIDFVALRPMSQNLPFPVPDSAHLFDVTRPAGLDTVMSTADPANGAAPQNNTVQAMGWEYVWHCHLLGHEENDMMREQVFQVPPQSPTGVSAVLGSSGGATVAFTDMSLSETGYTVERADDVNFTTNVKDFDLPGAVAGWNTPVSYTDSSANSNQAYYYRVRAYKPDADYWRGVLDSGPLGNNTWPDLVSPWSTAVQTGAAPALLVQPVSLAFGTQAFLTPSTPLALTLTDVGGAALNLNSVTIGGANPGDFAISASTCPAIPGALAAGNSCTLSIVFTPSYGGSRDAAVAIGSNDPVNPTVTVPLAGTGGLAPLTVAASSATVAYGSAVPAISPTLTGLLGTDTAASLGVTCSSTYTATSKVGSYPTSCTVANSTGYAITYVAGTVTVTPLAASVTPNAASKLWGTADPALTGTLSGFLPTDNVTATYSRAAGENVGTYTISATLAPPAVLSNYTITYNTAVFTIQAGPAAMISPAPGTVLPGASVLFTWNTGGGLSGYGLQVGTTGVGSFNLYNNTAIPLGSLSAQVSGLPINGSVVYVRLISKTATSQFTVDYTYTAASGPVLTSIVPNALTRGNTTAVALNGIGLTGATAVTVSGTGVTCVLSTVTATSATANCTVVANATLSPRNLTMTTPVATSAPVAISVVNPPAPSAASIAPSAGLRGAAVPVTVMGTNFTTTGTTMAVSGNGITVSGVTVVNSTTLNATLTVAVGTSLSSRNVTVTTPGGTSNPVTFTVVQPTISSISPASGAIGTTVPVTITGTNLAGATGVTVSGTGVACTMSGTPTATSVSANCVIASNAGQGARNVTVTSTANGTSNSLPGAFTVTGAAVSFSGPAPALITTPANTTAKTGTITVTNAATATGALTLTAAPAITRLSGSGTFSITGGTCAAGATVNPGSTCTIVVTYTPTNTASSSARVTLTGTGINGSVSSPTFFAN